MNIEREGFYPVQRYNLGTTLQPGKVYDLVLKPQPKVISMQFLMFKVSPADSEATIMYTNLSQDDGEKKLGDIDSEGSLAKKLVLGRYAYRIISESYHTSDGIVTLTEPDGKHIETVTLRPNFASITLTVENDAEIYINDEKRGTGQWSGNLAPGTYSIECHKTNHKSTLETITVEDGKNITHTLKAPTPIVGNLSISSSPLEAAIFIDGTSHGETPNVIKGLPIGTHTVTISKSGYKNVTRTIEVKADETLEVEIELGKFSSDLAKEPNTGETAETFLKAAKRGDAVAQYKLGICYEKGYGVSKDNKEAVKWYRKAAKRDNADAQYKLGYCYEKGYGVSADYKEAVKWYLKSAEQGNAVAQYQLGICYDKGRGVPKNYKQSFEWYRKSAEQGYVNAQYELGLCYYGGYGVSKDYKQAFEWYCKAAEQGNARAQNNLGVCYEKGYGVSKNLNEAVKWYRKSAEQGNASAQKNLGYCYNSGYGVSKEMNESVRWWRKAAEQGNASAQCSFGYCYRNGYGVSKDDNEAVKWYRKSAEQGEATAQTNLGYCYENGEGVTKDLNEAVKWYRKAAEQGNETAKNRLKILGY